MNMKRMSDMVEILGNVIAVSDDDGESTTEGIIPYLIQNGILEAIKVLFLLGTPKMKKEGLWLLSNIAANSERDAIAIMNIDFFPLLISAALGKNFEMKKEAIYVISNMISSIYDVVVIKKMVDNSVVHMLTEILTYDQESGIILILCLESMKRLFEKNEMAFKSFVSLGGQEIVEQLQFSPYCEVYTAARVLMETYFTIEEMTDAEKQTHFDKEG